MSNKKRSRKTTNIKWILHAQPVPHKYFNWILRSPSLSSPAGREGASVTCSSISALLGHQRSTWTPGQTMATLSPHCCGAQEKPPLPSGCLCDLSTETCRDFSIPSCIIQRSQLSLVFTGTIQALPTQSGWNNPIPLSCRAFFSSFLTSRRGSSGPVKMIKCFLWCQKESLHLFVAEKCRSS